MPASSHQSSVWRVHAGDASTPASCFRLHATACSSDKATQERSAGECRRMNATASTGKRDVPVMNGGTSVPLGVSPAMRTSCCALFTAGRAHCWADAPCRTIAASPFHAHHVCCKYEVSLLGTVPVVKKIASSYNTPTHTRTQVEAATAVEAETGAAVTLDGASNGYKKFAARVAKVGHKLIRRYSARLRELRPEPGWRGCLLPVIIFCIWHPASRILVLALALVACFCFFGLSPERAVLLLWGPVCCCRLLRPPSCL